MRTENNDAATRFASQVEDAKRDLAARKQRLHNDEPHDPVRAIIVNSLSFLLPILTLLGALIYSAVGLIAIVLLTVACIKIIKSDTLARWVCNGATFFLIGMICSILFFLLTLPVTVAISQFAR